MSFVERRSNYRKGRPRPYVQDCPHVVISGRRIRCLSEREIAQFQAAVEKFRSLQQHNEHVPLPEPPAEPAFPERPAMVVHAAGRDWPLSKP